MSKQDKFLKVDNSPFRPTSKVLSKKNSVKNTEGKNINNKTMVSTKTNMSQFK